jgi:YVTN family beta-propeller protein
VVSNNTVSVIEVSTNKVVDIINFKPEIVPEDVAVNGDYSKLYVLYYNITEWEQDDDYYYNGENKEHYIDTIDLSTKQIVASTRQPGNGRYALQGKPVKMLASEDGKYLYLMFVRYGLGHSYSTLYRYDTAANAYTASLHDLNEERSLYWVTDMALGDDGYLYIADRAGHTVYRITVPALDKFYRYFLWDYHAQEKLLWGIDVNTKTGRIFIADTDNDHKTLKSVTTVDMAGYNWYNWTGIASFETSSSPSLITLSPGGGVLYALEPTAKTVEAFSAPTYKSAASYSTGSFPADIALSPDGARLYVSNAGDDTVTAIDLTTGTPFAGSPIKVGNLPSRLVMGTKPQGNISINNSELHSRIMENLKVSVRPFPGLPNSTGSSSNSNNTIGGGLVLIDPNLGTFTRINMTDMTPPGSAPANETAPGNNTQAGNMTGQGGQQQASPAATAATPTGQATATATAAGASATPGFEWIAALSSIAAVLTLISLRRR